MSIYKSLVKPVLFLFQPERAHVLTFFLFKNALRIPGIKWLCRLLYGFRDQRLETVVAGIRFPNKVGLAAGLDKDAKMVDEFAVLGFGFVEIGTLTPLPQPGNEKPRLFRLPADNALINRMGFNNEGVKAAVHRLRNRKSDIVVGGNIGKNKVTPNDRAVDDYEKSFVELYDAVDYFVVNVSSPNTPGLRELQEKDPLKKILMRMQELNVELINRRPDGMGEKAENSWQQAAGSSYKSEVGSQKLEVRRQKEGSSRKPIFLKIAPDLSNEQLDEIIAVVNETRIDGIVATNTTISRDKLLTPDTELNAIGAGGLSGKPLADRSTEVIRYLHRKSEGKIPIIGVGGIHSAADAQEKIDAGASLIQLYTGFIYEGPNLVKQINQGLLSEK